ncbi:MAG: hypothetical protein EOP07_12805 [Proteobacteria bacterium]|nr:MAG: hypothetical protein EOP07_12805 [Pseudomonadota bacterium]
MMNLPKHMYSLIVAILLLSPFGFASALALPQDESSVAQARTELTELIRQLLSDIDPSAKVVVKLNVEKKNVKLPGTALTFKSSDLDQGDLYQSADITILSLDGKVPASVLALIRSTAADFAKNVSIKTRILPPEYQAANKKANAPPLLPEPEIKSWEEPLTEGLKQWSKVSTTLSQVLKPKLWKDTQIALKDLTRMISIALILLTLVAVGGIYLHSTSIKAFQRSMESLAQNQDSKASERPVENRSPAFQPESKGRESSTTASDIQQMIQQMPEGSLLSLLTDCYWTEEDAYAGFLWKRIPYNLRLQLIDHMPALFEYGSYVTELEEIDLGMEQDPSYLVPLPVHDVNMEQLTTQLRLYPSLYTRLSVMRKKALHLYANERLNFHRMDASQLPREPQSLSFDQSPARVLKKKLKLHASTFAQEMELLTLKTVDIDVVEALPSLGWLLLLPLGTAEKILQPFSAKDLASAWVGPEEVLAALEKKVGPKKYALMLSYRSKLSPSRSSDCFLRIHDEAIAAWRLEASQTLLKGDQQNAA